MMSDKFNGNLDEALDSVNSYEKKYRLGIMIFSLVLIVSCIGLLYYTYHKVQQYSKIASELESKTAYLTDSVNNLNKILVNLGGYSEFSTSWDSIDISIVEKNGYKKALAAHNKLIQIAKKENLNPFLSIRYYVKKQDLYPKFDTIKLDYRKNRVLRTLRKIGYSAINTQTENYRNSIATNVIFYSPSISKEDIKVIALALMRAGIQVKKIALYPKSIQKRKPNSVEISADKKLENHPSMTIEDVLTQFE